MKHTLSLLILLSAFAATVVCARIGETPAECVARYGEPIKIHKETNQLIFEKGKMLVLATFHEGKCEMLILRKIATNALGIPDELSNAEIEVLLEANSSGHRWELKENRADAKAWTLNEGEAIAVYSSIENYLGIYTREYQQRKDAEKEKNDRQSLNGF